MDADFLAPRHCLLAPLPEVFEAAHELERAAEAHLAGRAKEAAARIRAADIPSVAAWTKSIWGSDPENRIHRFRFVEGAPPPLSKEARLAFGPRMPSSAQRREIEARDGLRCRFCGIPVIRAEVRNLLNRCYAEARWGAAERDQHAGLQCLWLQYDHLLPFSRGGDSSADNVVVTCAACNFGRGNWTLEEVGLLDPRGRQPVSDGWDGLDRLLKRVSAPAAAPEEAFSEAAPDEAASKFDAPEAWAALDRFAAEAAVLGVTVETANTSRLLRWKGPDGTSFVLGGVDKNGRLNTWQVCWPAWKLGLVEQAYAYLHGLGDLVGAELRETPSPHQWHLVERGAKIEPRLDGAVDRQDLWMSLVARYQAALRRSLGESPA